MVEGETLNYEELAWQEFCEEINEQMMRENHTRVMISISKSLQVPYKGYLIENVGT